MPVQAWRGEGQPESDNPNPSLFGHAKSPNRAAPKACGVATPHDSLKSYMCWDATASAPGALPLNFRSSRAGRNEGAKRLAPLCGAEQLFTRFTRTLSIKTLGAKKCPRIPRKSMMKKEVSRRRPGCTSGTINGMLDAADLAEIRFSARLKSLTAAPGRHESILYSRRARARLSLREMLLGAIGVVPVATLYSDTRAAGALSPII